jgi:predicted ABC-type sugar transport system permease subunit
MYTYKVVELREKLLGGKMSGGKLENLLNEQAGQGWQLKAITAVEVKGRVGPGGVDGLLVTFERPADPPTAPW